MSYPQPPGYPMPYHASQLDGQQRPGGGTAITAGVLSVLGGVASIFALLAALGAIRAVEEIPDASNGAAVGAYVGLAGSILMMLLLLAGGILLFLRKRAGQWLVIAGCVVTLAVYIAAGVYAGSALSGASRSNDELVGLASGGIFVLVVAIIPALATLILAAIPPTTRYLRWYPGLGADYPGQYPGGYPGQGGAPDYGYPNIGGYPQQQQQQWGQTPPQW